MRWRLRGLAALACVWVMLPRPSALAVQPGIYAEGRYLCGIHVQDGVSAGDIAAWAEDKCADDALVLERNGQAADAACPAATGQTVEYGQKRLCVVVTGDLLGTGRLSVGQVTAAAKGLRDGFADEMTEMAADMNADGRVMVGDIVLAAKLLKSSMDGETSTDAAKTVQLVNAVRAKAGQRPLKLNNDLSRAAQVRVHEITASGKFSHTRPDGRKSTTVVEGPYAIGENLARIGGYPDKSIVEATVDALEQSAAHLKNMCLGCYTQMGAAYGKGKDGLWYSCHIFAGDGDVVYVDSPAAVRIAA